VLSSLRRRPLLMIIKNAPGWTRTKRIAILWKTYFIAALNRSGPLSLMPSKYFKSTTLLSHVVHRRSGKIVRDGLSGASIFGIWRYWARVRGL
jgi:hypothetical protein